MISKDFREFIELLAAASVRYLVVGGYAVAVHGYPPNRIDLLTSLEGLSFDDCYRANEPKAD